MIRRLRERHLQVFLVLAVLLTILLALALAARPEMPRLESTPWAEDSSP